MIKERLLRDNIILFYVVSEVVGVLQLSCVLLFVCFMLLEPVLRPRTALRGGDELI